MKPSLKMPHNLLKDTIYQGEDKENEEDDAGFTLVDRGTQRKRKRLMKTQEKQSQLYKYGTYCSRAENCPFGHTKEGIERFKTYGPRTPTKHRMCSNMKSCRVKTCKWGHDVNELHCLGCDKKAGHLTENCPERQSLTLPKAWSSPG